MDIFSTKPGIVVAVPSTGTPMTMILEGWDGFDVFKSIITGFSLVSASGVNFSHNLLDFIDVYTFGERISEFQLQGISFYAACDQEWFDENDQFVTTYHGLEYVLEYYNTHRASSLGMPLVASIGLGLTLEGFLIGCSLTAQDADRQVASFSLAMKAIPQVSILD
jgi:hypothetical protein